MKKQSAVVTELRCHLEQALITGSVSCRITRVRIPQDAVNPDGSAELEMLAKLPHQQ